MTVPFELPAAWRPAPADGTPAPADGTPEAAEAAEAAVGHQDLAEGLRALAAACDATPADVLLAAHVKVLGMLTEDRELHTAAVLRGTGGRPRAVTVHRGRPTWRSLVRQVAADTGAGAEPAPGVGRVLFTVGAAARHGGYGLEVTAEEGRLRLRARGDAVTPERLAVLSGMYRLVLRAMAADADGNALAAYLPPDERRAVLHRWASGGTLDRGPDGVDALIRAQTARTPNAPAVRTDQGGLSYRELGDRANRIAHHLIALGARPEDLVGVCLRRTLDLLPVLLGVWRSGAGYLPLDPGLPTERLRLMTESAGCRLVVTESVHLPVLGPVDGIRHVLLDADREAVDGRPPTAPAIPADPGALAYVIYTSGSTGTPKAVQIEHRGLANYLLWTAEAYAARGSGGSAVFSSISFDLGMPSLFTPLLTGQPVHLLPDPMPTADLGELLARGAPYSFLKMTPGQLDLLSLDLEPGEAHGLAGIVVAAGDAFTGELARRWIEAAGPGGTAVGTEYGPTEITVGNSGQPVTVLPGSELVPLGVPIPNTTMYVLTDRLEPVPVGVPGEVYIGGSGVARGYLGLPALTADRFLPDPWGRPGSRLYRTGDRARRLPDGSLEFLGRVDHQVKIRGYRVEPGEIQARLRRHADVAEVVVISVGATPRTRDLAAFVVPAPGAAPEAAGLRAHLAADLPEHMIPAHFVTVERVPLTGNGKVDARALQSLLRL